MLFHLQVVELLHPTYTYTFFLGPPCMDSELQRAFAPKRFLFGYQDMNMSCFVMNYQEENERNHSEDQSPKHWVLGSRTHLILCITLFIYVYIYRAILCDLFGMVN